MKKKLIVLSSAVLGFMPFVVAAASGEGNYRGCDSVQFGTIQSMICKVGNILDTLIPVLIILGIVFFVWGVITYVIGDDEEAKKRGKNKMIYGIIGLVVIVTMWGLVNIVQNTFELNEIDNNIVLPSIDID